MPQFVLGSQLLAAEMPPGNILHFDKQLLLEIGVAWINIIVLTAVMIFLLYKPVRKYMADRTARIQSEIETAKSERDEAQELKEQYEKLILGIEQEREEILLHAHKKAVEKSDQILFDSRREAELIYTRSLSELETERENVNDEMKRQIIEIATLMAGQFVEVSIDRPTQDRLIEEALADWEEG